MSSSTSWSEEVKIPIMDEEVTSYAPLLLSVPSLHSSISSTKFQEMRNDSLDGTDSGGGGRRRWNPIAFRSWFIIGLILLMLGLSITMELLLYLSRINNGFSNAIISSGNLKGIHFFYTGFVVVLSLPVVSAWRYHDYCCKSIQPYIDLDQGLASADRSVLLNYNAENNFLVLLPTLKRKHFLTFLSTVMCIVTLIISPLSSSLLLVAPISLPTTNYTAQATTQLGFLDDPTFSSFASSSGFALAQAQFNASWPPFVNADGAITKFNALQSWGKNGTIVSNVLSVKTVPNCIPVVATKSPNLVTITTSKCTTSFNVVDSLSVQVEVHLVNCEATIEPQFQPVAFISFTSTGSDAVVCTPTLSVLEVVATMDLASNELSTVSSGAISNSVNPLQHPPLNGNAINGIGGSTLPVPARLTATLINLSTAVAVSSGDLVTNANAVYGSYLTLLSLSAYFIPVSTTIPVQLNLVQLRLVVSDITAHILAAVFAFLAISGALLDYFHRRSRRNIFLPSSPGTIASAASIAGNSDLSYLIEPRDDSKTCSKLLRRHKFTLDRNGRIVIVQNAGDYGTRTKRASFFDE